jgi:CheY-like chemotaxis protein
MSLTSKCCFRQQFRRDLRSDRFTMEFAQTAPMALQRIADAGDRSLILILSDIKMPGMSGLEPLPKAKALRPNVPVIMITAYGDAETPRSLGNSCGSSAGGNSFERR